MLCPDQNALHFNSKRLASPDLVTGHALGQRSQQAPTQPRWVATACCWAALLICVGAGAQTELNPSPAALELQRQAREWYSQQKSYPLDHIQIAATDSKLAVSACATQIRFDLPFSNQNVVRARCSEPNSQYFMTAQVSPMVLGKTTTREASAALPSPPAGKTADPSPVSSSKAPTPAPSTPVFLPATYKPNINPNEVIKTVLVANQPLRRGTVLQANLFRRVDTPIANTDGQVLTQFKEIENSELLHDMGSDQVLHNFDIKPTLMVKRGQQVTVMIGEGKGFLITVKAEAQQDGALGDQIRLKNIDSGRSISGVITGMNEVKVL
jgi:flagella basal body P-ring formation protein FlgA